MAIAPNPLQAFIWGRGGAALTPEQVAREREIAEALMKEGADYSPVEHWLQGAARLGNTLSGKIKEGRAASQEAEGRAAYKSLWDSAFGGGGQSDVAASLAGSPATSTAMATAPAPDYASARVAQAHNAGGASIPTGERAEYIRQGLINRGLPNHVADAFLMNFQDESGLNPGINEVAPLVPGSRGGYGLYQLTGPRRREYEAFAAERGSPLDDIDAQLDFLMQEGSGSERAAFERILAAPDTGTAASEIVNRFLRPAQAHRESRAARYARAPNTAVAANDAMVAGSLAGVPVAETEQDILAQEAAMSAQDPMAFQQPAMPSSTGTQPGLSQAAPPLPDPQMVQDRPVATALTNAPLTNPDMPLAGGTQGFAPLGTQAPNVSLPGGASFSLPDPSMAVAQSLAAQPQQQGGMPNMQQLMQLASDPWANDAQRQVAAALMKQQMEQNDPYRQAQLEKIRLETEALRNPTQKPIEVGGVLLDPVSYEPIFDSRSQNDNGFTLSPGQQRFDAAGNTIAVGGDVEPSAPTVRQIKLADGSEALVQWNPETGVWDPARLPEGGTTGAGQPTKKLTETQAKTTLFQTMQNETAPVLGEIESIWSPANIGDAIARQTPIAGNFFQSEQGQIYNSASGAWAEGALRISTGAAATQPEIERIQKVYFAQPGDTPNVIEFKRGMRDMYTRAINASLGQDTSQQGALVLPDDFAKKYKAAVPSPDEVKDEATQVPPGIDPQVWEFMTPEEKALFK